MIRNGDLKCNNADFESARLSVELKGKNNSPPFDGESYR